MHSYHVNLVAAIDYFGTGGRAQHPSIFLSDATGRFFARINFRPNEDLEGVSVGGSDGLPFYYLGYPLGDYQHVLDILRNEKPVHLQVNVTAKPTAVLSTSPEPIGEGEVTF